jgi:hypothetical protein
MHMPVRSGAEYQRGNKLLRCFPRHSLVFLPPPKSAFQPSVSKNEQIPYLFADILSGCSSRNKRCSINRSFPGIRVFSIGLGFERAFPLFV